ncbi:hypothetical protein SANT12839_054730 [Streptomyces antimycoticus]|uniref:Amino acid permease/ SLC12A domain-containing protein n=1 Tax=Streptomyces antimycoticus TaxID=68175 RepID=A0A4D4K656_9ACTN|nr:hypothetical protein SANT12839_054730 [Streptomyces antimycoticus]
MADPAAPIQPPDRPAYRLKRLLLGPPLVTERIRREKLGNPAALGVLASDCISSTAYGSEEMLRVLVPVIGVAAFSLILPVTGTILLVLLLVTLCYSDVVMIYTRAGGSYVVARDNFGPDIAQIASVALLVDYIVTVAVQVSAGTNAIISFAHLVGGTWTGIDHLQLPLSALVILILAYGNLRGLREAGRVFMAPAYLFIVAIGLMLVVGVVRGLTGRLPHADVHAAGAVHLGTPDGGWLYGASLFIVLRSFANGGSSLTGLEAISNSVSVFRDPKGHNARRTLITMSCILGTLVLGSPPSPTSPTPSRTGTAPRPSSRRRPIWSSATGRWAPWGWRSSSWRPRSSSTRAPTRRSPASPSWPASWPRTAFCPGSSPGAATGWPSPTGSSRWPWWRWRCWWSPRPMWTGWWRCTRSACSPPSPWPGPG